MDSFDRLKAQIGARRRSRGSRTPLADTTNVVSKQRFGKTKIHGFTPHPTNRGAAGRGIPIFNLKAVIQTAQPQPAEHRDRPKLAGELKADSTNENTVHIHRNIRQFVAWFKYNKVNHLLDAKYRSEGQVGVSTKEMHTAKSAAKPQSLAENLFNQKYIRPEFRANKASLQPTHSIVSSRQVGKFMYSAEVAKAGSSRASTVLLMTTDMTVNLHPETLIVLDERSMYLQAVGTSHIPTYLIWHIYR